MTTEIKNKIQELKSLRDKASEGLWSGSAYYVSSPNFDVAQFDDPCDAKFSVESANRWNDLLKCIELACDALEHINEYWNRDANESATLNACEFAITKTDQALSEIKNILENK